MFKVKCLTACIPILTLNKPHYHLFTLRFLTKKEYNNINISDYIYFNIFTITHKILMYSISFISATGSKNNQNFFEEQT